MREKVYIETSVISYLSSRPSSNLLIAAQQSVTHDWWNSRRTRFDLFISEFVLVEISKGDVTRAEERMKKINELPLLDLTDDVTALAKNFLAHSILDSSIFRRSIDDMEPLVSATK